MQAGRYAHFKDRGKSIQNKNYICLYQDTLSQQVPKLMKFTQQTRSDRHAVCNYLCVSEEADCRTYSGSVTFCKTLFSKRK